MNAKIYVVTAILACVGLLLTGFSGVAGELETNVTLSIGGVIQHTSTEIYTYIINVTDSNYQMLDGTTRQIDYQSTNATQVINSAIGNLTQDGGKILFSTGVYNLTGSIYSDAKDNVTLVFEKDAKLFVASNMNAPAIRIKYANNWLITGATINGNAVGQSSLDDMRGPSGIVLEFSNNTQVSNAIIDNVRYYGVNIIAGGGLRTQNSGVVNSKITNCGWNGIQLGGSDSANELSLYAISNEIAYCSDVGITTYGSGNIITGNNVHDMNGTMGFNNPNIGIAVEGGRNHIITHNNVKNCRTGINVMITAPWGGSRNITISNNVISNDITYQPDTGATGIALGSGVQNEVVRDNNVTGIYCHSSSWNFGVGILLTNASFNFVIGNTIIESGSIGILSDSNSNNNTVNLNSVSDTKAGNFFGTTHMGTGIDVFGNNNYLNENQVFDSHQGAARTQKYGIVEETGALYNTLIGNKAYNNLFLNFYFSNNVPESTMINNTGYNPVGYIANPISGNTAYLIDSGNNYTWISGRVYTNTGSPKVLDISLGEVLAVTKNGVMLFTTTGCTLTLNPSDTFSIFFSSPPTIRVEGQ